jgi:chromate reductase, NAD(P)H dehydrogenase (quinone)
VTEHSTTLRILGLCGSLRRDSYNGAALRAAGTLMPPGMVLGICEIGDIPFFDQDVLDRGIPESVQRLCAEVRASDGILIASPEYNFSVTAVLKNAIDWLSRLQPMPFKDKPVALLSAATGLLGGARVQYDLRRILGQLYTFVLVRPEVFIGGAATKFNASGDLVDEATAKVIAEQMVAFRLWIERLTTVSG